MEKDDEVKGEGNSINYEARMQDTRVGRFLSIDPLAKSFPHYSPYQFAGNTPIQAIDLDGAEEYHYLANFNKKTGTIVFKLESSKTVKKKTFLFWSWTPKERHTVVYQNDNGTEDTFIFTSDKYIRLGNDYELINGVSDFRKFVRESKNSIYKNQEEAEKGLNDKFANEDAIMLGQLSGALVDYTTSKDAFITKLPIIKKSPKISNVIESAERIVKGNTKRGIQSLDKKIQRGDEAYLGEKAKTENVKKIINDVLNSKNLIIEPTRNQQGKSVTDYFNPDSKQGIRLNSEDEFDTFVTYNPK
jgi:RHS repeat-associated protein